MSLPPTSTHALPPVHRERIDALFAEDRFFDELAGLVAHHTVSAPALDVAAQRTYLAEEITPRLEALGCTVETFTDDGPAPFLVGRRVEGDDLPTVLVYAHADVVTGHEGRWTDGRDPWTLTRDGDRWYGRGTADNKGQHLVNLTALQQVLDVDGSLGFNLTWLMECGEEAGSPGLVSFVENHTELLAADLLIASDGPRLAADVPTLFLGSRGGVDVTLDVDLRPGSFHSGNWGGVLRNAATTLAAAITCLVDGQGHLLVDELQPPALSPAMTEALSHLEVSQGADDPAIDPTWGDPDLDPVQRLYGGNTLEVLAMNAADVDHPVNAIPGRAVAQLQLRYVIGTDVSDVPGAIRRRLEAHGLGMVDVRQTLAFPASRSEPDDPWVQWALAQLQANCDVEVRLLPHIGGSIPNHVFTDTLGLTTLWLPHSYPGSRQHGPDEHALESILRQGLTLATGLFHGIGHADEGAQQ